MMDREKIPFDDEEAIDNAIDEWHKGAGKGMELYEWLGWTWEEYSVWVGKRD